MLTQELQRRFSRDAGIQDAAESLRGLLNHKLIPVMLVILSSLLSACIVAFAGPIKAGNRS